VLLAMTSAIRTSWIRAISGCVKDVTSQSCGQTGTIDRGGQLITDHRGQPSRIVDPSSKDSKPHSCQQPRQQIEALNPVMNWQPGGQQV